MAETSWEEEKEMVNEDRAKVVEVREKELEQRA